MKPITEDNHTLERIRLLEGRTKVLSRSVFLLHITLVLILIVLIWPGMKVARGITAILANFVEIGQEITQHEREQHDFIIGLSEQMQDLVEQLDDETKIPDAALRAEVTLLNQRVRSMEEDLSQQPAIKQRITDMRENYSHRFESLEGWVQLAYWSVLLLAITVVLSVAALLRSRKSA